MDFELSEDQAALVDGVTSLLAGRFPNETVRSLQADGGVRRDLWHELAETGVFGLALPEADGGVGLGWIDAVLVFEQLGRALVPGPLVATTLAAGLIDGAVSGDTVVGYLDRADPSGLVEYAEVIDVLVIGDDDGLRILPAGELTLIPEPRPLDPLTPVAVVADLPRGEALAGPDQALTWQRRGAVLTSALQLGLATGAMELAVAYAKERQQFGKPIGSFQAVKHLCADMLGRAEVCRAAVYLAGLYLDDADLGDVDRAVSVARIQAGQAAGNNGKDCTQVHGGMGYTWEVDAHLFVKRAWVLETSFGSPDEHADRLAATV